MTMRPKPVTLNVPASVREFLEAASKRAGTDISAILEAILGTRPVTEFPEAKDLTGKLNTETVQVLEELDRLLRTANPGSQMVFRAEYIGYRRFDNRLPSGVKASRSQVYASLLPRKSFIRVVVPLNAADYPNVNDIIDLSKKGHHGVGDMAVDIHSVDQANAVVSALDDWLGPARTFKLGRHF